VHVTISVVCDIELKIVSIFLTLKPSGWHITHTALRTDMRMLAEALGALRTWLDADEELKPWQVTRHLAVCVMVIKQLLAQATAGVIGAVTVTGRH